MRTAENRSTKGVYSARSVCSHFFAPHRALRLYCRGGRPAQHTPGNDARGSHCCGPQSSKGEEGLCDPVPITAVRTHLGERPLTPEGPMAFHACLIGSANSALVLYSLPRLRRAVDCRSHGLFTKRSGPAKPACKDERVADGDCTEISLYHCPKPA
jgi:hypothetical protein